MSHGLDQQREQEALDNALAVLAATLEQHKLFFAPRLPQIYQRLRYMVRYCRHHRREHNQALAQQALQEELHRLFGLRLNVPFGRQLSLLAALIRYVLVVHSLHEVIPTTRGGVQLLLRDIHHRLNAATVTSHIDLTSLDAALKQLAQHHVNSVRLLELRYFARLSTRDMALELNLAWRELEHDLRFAKAWLLAYMRVEAKK